MDERKWAVVTTMHEFMQEVLSEVRATTAGKGPKLNEVLREHLGVSPAELPVVRLDVMAHQFVNLDIAMDALVERHGGGAVVGVGGGSQRHHQTFGDMLQELHGWSTSVGPVDRTRVDTGPDTMREAIATGVHLFRYDGTPVAVLQRLTSPQFGNPTGLEVIAAGEVSEHLLADVRTLMVERSVFRGQVLSFGLTDTAYGPSAGGIAFVERPAIGADQVILPSGALARIERHVVGPARHRDALRAAGQHLKRGLLLYGPPGTGKTHTVRYLLGQMQGITAIILAGNALSLVAEATELARALQPAVVVMEDIDLIAEHREYHMGPQPLLFTLLDAMDGLSSDADVAFILTTNRADLLEEALTQRPGRVDFAVEVPRPDVQQRRALVDLYVRELPFSSSVLDTVADRSDGVTASFFKELARRTVLTAADRGHALDDAVLVAALDEMLSDQEHLTRRLLAGRDRGEPSLDVDLAFGDDDSD